MPHTYDYPRPNAAVDIIVLDHASAPTQILLIQRKNEPFAEQWAFPGGFIDENEDPSHAAARELAEETNLADLPLTPFRFYGAPKRDPRFHCLSCVFATYADPASVSPVAADDAAATQWHPLNKLPHLAFDHSQILSDYLATLS